MRFSDRFRASAGQLLCLLLASAIAYTLMSRPTLASNREVDSGLGHALGGYVSVMCYNVWVVCDSHDPAVYASVCEAILRQELIRVDTISPTT